MQDSAAVLSYIVKYFSLQCVKSYIDNFVGPFDLLDHSDSEVWRIPCESANYSDVLILYFD